LLRPGAGKLPLFFVHDGDGEVMPYHGLAQQIRPGHPIYGLPPIGSDGHIMTPTRLGQVAAVYLQSVKKIQPRGPYLLGGLCIGGFVAFEMARQLEASGEQVGLLALMDAAYANATHKSVAKRRMHQFQAVLDPTASETSRVKSAERVIGAASRKIKNLLTYEATTRSKRALKRAKIHALRYAVDRQLPPPPFARGLTVDDVLRFAEKEYETPSVYPGTVHLLLATKTDPVLEENGINDTPYQELFEQKHVGWDGKVAALHVHEVSGGHSSMLQSPNVAEIAAIIHERLDQLEGADG
jgi:thioesterase domain-containing protein